MHKQSLILLTIAATLLSSLAIRADDPISERQDLMDGTRDALKAMVKMVRGEAEFDADTVTNSLNTMQNTAATAGDLFPPGSETGGDTEALPSIWSDREGFNQAMDHFAKAVDTALAANPQSVADLNPVLRGITKTCKGCHDDYRQEKDN
jgi:cytochrome c556